MDTDLWIAASLRLTTHLIQIKNIKRGNGRLWWYIYRPHDMKIGVLPIGYHDGIDRRLSGVGVVMIRGQKVCPIIGRVSMNITTIDLSSIDAQEGDEVLIIDENRDSPVSLLASQNEPIWSRMICSCIWARRCIERYLKINVFDHLNHREDLLFLTEKWLFCVPEFFMKIVYFFYLFWVWLMDRAYCIISSYNIFYTR